MLAEDLVMISLLMESVVVSFTLGGVIGALIAVHLVRVKNESVGYSNQKYEIPDGERRLQEDVGARVRIPPRH